MYKKIFLAIPIIGILLSSSSGMSYQPDSFIFRVSSAEIAVNYTDFDKVNPTGRNIQGSNRQIQRNLSYPHHYTADSKLILLPNPNYLANSSVPAKKYKFFAYSGFLSTVVFAGDGLGQGMKPLQLTNQSTDVRDGNKNIGLWLEAAFYNTDTKKFQGLFHQEQLFDYRQSRTYKNIVYAESLDGLSWQIKDEVLSKVGGVNTYRRISGPLIRGHGDFTAILGNRNDFNVGKTKTPFLIFYFNQGTRSSDRTEQDGNSIALVPDWNSPYDSWKWDRGNGSDRSHYQSLGLGGASKSIPALFYGGSVAWQSQDQLLLAISDSQTARKTVDLSFSKYSNPTNWSILKDPFLLASKREYFKYFNFADDSGTSKMDRNFYITYSYRDALNQAKSIFNVWNPKSAGQYSTIAYHKVKMIPDISSGKPKVGWQITRHVGEDNNGQSVQKVTWALGRTPQVFNGDIYRGIKYQADKKLGYVYTSNANYSTKMDSLYLVYTQSDPNEPKKGRYRIFKNLSTSDIMTNKFGYMVQFLGFAWKPGQNPKNIKTAVLKEYQMGDSYGYFLETETVPIQWGTPKQSVASIELD
jgi:hypothetical protein